MSPLSVPSCWWWWWWWGWRRCWWPFSPIKCLCLTSGPSHFSPGFLSPLFLTMHPCWTSTPRAPAIMPVTVPQRATPSLHSSSGLRLLVWSEWPALPLVVSQTLVQRLSLQVNASLKPFSAFQTELIFNHADKYRSNSSYVFFDFSSSPVRPWVTCGYELSVQFMLLYTTSGMLCPACRDLQKMTEWV